MNNTIQDETFGEITFDGLNWIRTEPVTMTIAGKTFELRTEIESPDLVYDWARLGKLSRKQSTRFSILNWEAFITSYPNWKRREIIFRGLFLRAGR